MQDFLSFEASYFHAKMEEFDKVTKERALELYAIKKNLLSYKQF